MESLPAINTHGNRKPTTLGLSISMPLLATIAVLLRFYAHRVKRVKLGVEDLFIVIGLVFAIANAISTIIAVTNGNLGGHTLYSPDGNPLHVEQFVVFTKCIWTIQYFSVLSAGFTKLSILFFYKRIFVGTMFPIILWTSIGIVCVWTISIFFANFLDCIPLSVNWRLESVNFAGCVNIKELLWATCISDIITDGLILTLPWYRVWKLQMPMRRKVAVCGIFLLGGFVVLAGILRFTEIVASTDSEETNLDFTYSKAPGLYWTVVETCIGVVSACLPLLRPLLAGNTPHGIISILRSMISQMSLRKTSQVLSEPSRGDDHISLVQISNQKSSAATGAINYSTDKVAREAMVMV